MLNECNSIAVRRCMPVLLTRSGMIAVPGPDNEQLCGIGPPPSRGQRPNSAWFVRWCLASCHGIILDRTTGQASPSSSYGCIVLQWSTAAPCWRQMVREKTASSQHYSTGSSCKMEAVYCRRMAPARLVSRCPTGLVALTTATIANASSCLPRPRRPFKLCSHPERPLSREPCKSEQHAHVSHRHATCDSEAPQRHASLESRLACQCKLLPRSAAHWEAECAGPVPQERGLPSARTRRRGPSQRAQTAPGL